jgi:DtxR family Mn-dependent transcriptional regulator
LKIEKQLLSELAENQKRNLCRGEGYFIRVLEYLKQEIALGSEIEIIEKESFDSSFRNALELKK